MSAHDHLRFVLRDTRPDGESAAPNARLYARYRLGDGSESFGVVTLPGGARHALLDVSYGGFSVARAPLGGSAPAHEPQARDPVLLHIESLGDTLVADAAALYRTDAILGFVLEHTQSDVVAFLQRTLPYLAVGAGLRDAREIDGGRDEDVRLRAALMVDGGAVDLRFFDGKVETRAAFDAGVCATAHTLGSGGELGELTLTRRIDPLILRKAALVLRGLAQADGRDAVVAAADLAREHWLRAAEVARRAPWPTAV